MNPTNRIDQSFFTQDVLTIAPLLLGIKLVCRDKNGIPTYYIITETEAYYLLLRRDKKILSLIIMCNPVL